MNLPSARYMFAALLVSIVTDDRSVDSQDTSVGTVHCLSNEVLL